MTPALDHLKRFPKARASTLVFLIEREKVNARLEAEIEARVAGQIAAAFRTFPINIKRAFVAGRL